MVWLKLELAHLILRLLPCCVTFFSIVQRMHHPISQMKIAKGNTKSTATLFLLGISFLVIDCSPTGISFVAKCTLLICQFQWFLLYFLVQINRTCCIFSYKLIEHNKSFAYFLCARTIMTAFNPQQCKTWPK